MMLRLVLLALFVATHVEAGTLTASWTDTNGGSASTEIERRFASDDVTAYALLASVAPGVTQYADSTVLDGVEYCYRVQATDGVSESPNSEEACGMVASASPPPPDANISGPRPDNAGNGKWSRNR